MVTITIQGGAVTVGAQTYWTLNFEATNNGDIVTIRSTDLSRDIICEGPYDQITVTGYGVQASAAALVVLFNELTNNQSTGDVATDVAAIKTNTDTIATSTAGTKTNTDTIKANSEFVKNALSCYAYVGKPSNGDFITAYSGPTAIAVTLSSAGLTAITDKDIEIIKQVNNAGTVVNTFTRSGNIITVAANIITVAGATFAATDTFIVYTNVPRVSLLNVMGTTYIGKKATATGKDFVTAYASGTTITLSSYPAGISGFTGDDIEFVRQINSSGLLVKTFSRINSTISITGSTLSIAEASFAASDTFVVVTNVAKLSSVAAGAGGGSIVYSNMSGDFIATITNATKNITITGLPFTLEAMHVAAGNIKKIAVTTNVVSNLPLTNISVSGGVITLSDADNFATGDIVVVTLIGPDKSYDRTLDNTKVIVQNPQYGHYTSVETIISETNMLGYKGNTTGTDADTLANSAAPFVAANVALGYLAWQTTDNASAIVNSFTSTSVLETATLSGGASWYPAGAKAYSVPYCQRYEIPMEGYNYLTLQWSLKATTNCNAYLKIYGTLDATATADADTAWIDLSADLFGAAAGITVPTGTTAVEGMLTIDTPTPMLKYMLKLVVESNTGSANTNVFTVLAKKSS